VSSEVRHNLRVITSHGEDEEEEVEEEEENEENEGNRLLVSLPYIYSYAACTIRLKGPLKMKYLGCTQ
jgi:hypothetical protein